MRKAGLKSQISDQPGGQVTTLGLIVCSVLFVAMSSIAGGSQQGPANPLTDGTVLASVDGKLVPGDAPDAWLFELAVDVNSLGGRAIAGTRFELLPCATLELLLVDANDRTTPMYRLSGRVTRYKDKDFLFLTYYLPLSKLKDTTSPTAQGETTQARPETPGSDEGDPDLTIPQEVMEKLRDRRMTRGVQRESRESGTATKSQRTPDRMIVDAVGRIEPAASGHLVFVPDAFGWNIDKARYELLPCHVLEQTWQSQAASPDPIRFNIAGLVTEFKGEKYLLLHRAIRAYGHGNFIK
ncbi:MAG: hypothetical protein JW955_18330 [Sedimentisphaerales bacterium]|nr:hypothetical protein [Sedimentisphaerales bacterium]